MKKACNVALILLVSFFVCSAVYAAEKKYFSPVTTEKISGKVCPTDGEIYPDSENFCGKHGAKLISKKIKVCPTDGEVFPNSENFCGKHGVKLISKKAYDEEKARLAAKEEKRRQEEERVKWEEQSYNAAVMNEPNITIGDEGIELWKEFLINYPSHPLALKKLKIWQERKNKYLVDNNWVPENVYVERLKEEARKAEEARKQAIEEKKRNILNDWGAFELKVNFIQGSLISGKGSCFGGECGHCGGGASFKISGISSKDDIIGNIKIQDYLSTNENRITYSSGEKALKASINFVGDDVVSNCNKIKKGAKLSQSASGFIKAGIYKVDTKVSARCITNTILIFDFKDTKLVDKNDHYDFVFYPGQKLVINVWIYTDDKPDTIDTNFVEMSPAETEKLFKQLM